MGFALRRSAIGQENSPHPPSQSDTKLKPIGTWSLGFPALEAVNMYLL